MANTDTNTVGSVMVVGGGVAGIQAALDLANSGFFVYLVEKASAIGGTMSQLDKTFPTNDCSMCIISPKLVECGQHPNIELLTLSEPPRWYSSLATSTGPDAPAVGSVLRSARCPWKMNLMWVCQ
jgi:phytoene dehydrogenase-like protein